MSDERAKDALNAQRFERDCVFDNCTGAVRQQARGASASVDLKRAGCCVSLVNVLIRGVAGSDGPC
jgi:hypothetical protein